MVRVGRFEEEWQSLKEDCEYGSFSYDDSSVPIGNVISSHFRNVHCQERYGVYVVRRQATREVLYIGKGGTVESDGNFKGQDVPGRLKNVKAGDVLANQWFRDLVDEKGPLLIEYAFTTATPKSPAFVEAVLLQAHLNEHGRLPYLNKAF